MKRFIDAEKLKAEIQRRFNELNEEYERTASFRCDGGMDELDKLDTFIDSLQQEQPEADLEQEYKKWWDSVKTKINIEHTMEWYMHEAARRFAEWGVIHHNARKEK